MAKFDEHILNNGRAQVKYFR